MTNRVKIILNTYGGTLAVQTKIDLVEKGMEATGLDYQIALTEYGNHATELAAQTVLEGVCSTIVAAGGDGTINEVLNGMMKAVGQGEPITFGILPLGTANDLAHILNLPLDIMAACQRISAGNTRLIDLGLVNGHYFVNNSAVGLEPMVTLEHEKLRRINSTLRYIVAALKVIANAQFWTMRLNWGTHIYEGPIILVSVGNSARTGGSFHMTPQAEVDDGLLDFIYASRINRFQMLRLLPQTFSGKHIHHSAVVYKKTPHLLITSSPPTPIQADGQIIDKAATEITYTIIPQKLRVIV